MDSVLQSSKSTVIAAHKGRISALALSKEARMLATMSEKGTLIRLFNPESGEQLHELRRGSEPAIIHGLQFEHETSKFLLCSSNKDTIHVYNVDSIGKKDD